MSEKFFLELGLKAPDKEVLPSLEMGPYDSLFDAVNTANQVRGNRVGDILVDFPDEAQMLSWNGVNGDYPVKTCRVLTISYPSINRYRYY